MESPAGVGPELRDRAVERLGRGLRRRHLARVDVRLEAVVDAQRLQLHRLRGPLAVRDEPDWAVCPRVFEASLCAGTERDVGVVDDHLVGSGERLGRRRRPAVPLGRYLEGLRQEVVVVLGVRHLVGTRPQLVNVAEPLDAGPLEDLHEHFVAILVVLQKRVVEVETDRCDVVWGFDAVAARRS